LLFKLLLFAIELHKNSKGGSSMNGWTLVVYAVVTSTVLGVSLWLDAHLLREVMGARVLPRSVWWGTPIRLGVLCLLVLTLAAGAMGWRHVVALARSGLTLKLVFSWLLLLSTWATYQWVIPLVQRRAFSQPWRGSALMAVVLSLGLSHCLWPCNAFLLFLTATGVVVPSAWVLGVAAMLWVLFTTRIYGVLVRARYDPFAKICRNVHPQNSDHLAQWVATSQDLALYNFEPTKPSTWSAR
jgi:hypothetical protein